MSKKASLKRHILALALGAIVLVWLAAAVFTFFDAREELNEVLDAHLAQASTLLVAQASHELEEIETDHAPLLHKYSRRIAFQVWEDGRELRLHSANAPETPLGKPEQGFSDTTIDGRHWRVFSTWDKSGGLLIHVAEQAEVRNELARSVAANLLRPLWVALPVLAILIWWAVGNGLRPLMHLTHEIERRAPDNLAPLDATSTPLEVTPLIERLNQLFKRIGSAMDNERRFTADAAHELRTPIAAIRAQAQVARSATGDAERIHALDGAIAGCDRATHLIEQLLTLARLENATVATLEPCDLRALSTRVLAELAPAALDRDVHIEFLGDEELTVRGIPGLLAVMLRNLVDNAVRHTPAGTTVTVELSGRQAHSCITIHDDGPGLPADELEKISQRFYRPLGTAADGSGLGLSIVRRIAELHGATLEFSSSDRQGGLRVKIRFSPA